MKRLTQLFFVLILVAAFGAPLGAAAQDAPTGVFYGAWPYFIPPDGHLNSFTPHGPTDVGNPYYYKLIELPFAWYMWAAGDYEPILAESWEFEGDTAFMVHLRQDAMWSNGTPVTADDVIATYAIGRIMKWSDYNYVGEVEKVDDYTVRFTLSTPSYAVQRIILRSTVRSAETYGELAAKSQELYASGATSEDQAWLDLQTEIKEFRPEELIVSGPFTYTLDDVNDSYMTLHWQPNSLFSETVKFGEIRLWYGETEAVTPIVLDGQVTYATHGFPPVTEQSFVDAGLRILRFPFYYGGALYFNHSLHPWNIKEVRQAVAMVIDRSENSFLTKGLSAKPVQYMVGFSDTLVPLWLDEEAMAGLNKYEYNPEAADELLLSIGFSRDADGKWLDADGNPVKAEFIFQAEWLDFQAGALNAIEQMNDFGFDITGRSVQWQQLDDQLRKGDFELTIRSWGVGSPFPSEGIFNPLRGYNTIGLTEGQTGINFPMTFEWNGEEIDYQKLIADSAAGLDVEAQKALVTKAAQIYNDLLPVIPMSEILANNPLNENLVAGAPPEDDPIWLNAGGDSAITYLLLTGVLEPGPGAQ